jgi:hypothetical protein
MSVFLRGQIMRVMQGHKGRANAMPRRDLLEHLRLYRIGLSDRECRELYSGLPICSCSEGLFLPQTVAEVQDFKAYIAKAWGPIQAHRRCATIFSFYPRLAPPAFQQELPL